MAGDEDQHMYACQLDSDMCKRYHMIETENQSTRQPSELRHVWASLIIVLKESSSYKRFTLFNHILIYPF